MVNETPDDCASCALPATRRAFLRDSFLAITGALLAVGMSESAAIAAPIAAITGRKRADQTVKYPIPSADGVQIDKANQVILVRWQNDVYAFNLSCPHQNTALRWDDADHRFQCPKHHSKYRPDGVFIEGRATRGMDRLAIQRQGADLVVDLDKMFKEDEDGAAWTAAVIPLTT
jgi:Rieske Fe-S protein